MKEADIPPKKGKEQTRKVAAQLIKEIAKAEGVISAIGDGISIVDRTYRILYENQVHKDMLGTHVGNHCYEAYQRSEGVCGGCPIALTFKDGNVHTVERELRGEKEARHMEITASPLKNGKGEIIAGIEVVRDITKRKWIEEMLRHERDRARTYFDTAEVIMLVLDTDRKVARINRKGCKVLGYREEELVGKDWFDSFIPGKIREEVKEVFMKIITGDMYPVEYFENEVLTKDGQERLIAWHNTIIKDELGNVTGALSSGEDITERRKAEKALHENEYRLGSIFRAAPIGIGVVSSPDRILLKVNERLCTMLGYPAEELIGKSARMLYPTDKDFEHVGKKKYDLIGKYGIGTLETRWKQKDGRILDILLSSSPIDRHDLALGVTFTALDITDGKRSEELLRQSEAKLREKVKALEEFYNIAVGRELRMKQIKEENELLKKELEKYRQR